MYPRRMPVIDPVTSRCQIVRTLDVVGEKWSLLIVRDALRGRATFSEFRESLGVPTDVLSARLAKLVERGVLEKRAYRASGSRERASYHLTEAGRGLALVIGAMAEWGERYNPREGGTTSHFVEAGDPSAEVGVSFVDAAGRRLADSDVVLVPRPR
jgi:DNA-binding HxlR family transcriptional regulator